MNGWRRPRRISDGPLTAAPSRVPTTIRGYSGSGGYTAAAGTTDIIILYYCDETAARRVGTYVFFFGPGRKYLHNILFGGDPLDPRPILGGILYYMYLLFYTDAQQSRRRVPRPVRGFCFLSSVSLQSCFVRVGQI